MYKYLYTAEVQYTAEVPLKSSIEISGSTLVAITDHRSVVAILAGINDWTCYIITLLLCLWSAIIICALLHY